MSLIPLSYRWLAGGLLLVGLLLGSYLHGRNTMVGEIAREQRDNEHLAAAQLAAKQRRVDVLSATLEAARAAQKPKDRIITKEIIRYETTVPADRRCMLDGAWRVLHDAAATGQPADPARLAAGAAASVTDAAALDTVGENYNRCRDAIDQVTGWQAWYAIVKPPEPHGQP
jgi:hypothetical protein